MEKIRSEVRQYVISFLEGIITFISPCLMPMLPIYISYFAGGGERTGGKTFKNALGFVLGFSAVFAAAFALVTLLVPKKARLVVTILLNVFLILLYFLVS